MSNQTPNSDNPFSEQLAATLAFGHQAYVESISVRMLEDMPDRWG